MEDTCIQFIALNFDETYMDFDKFIEVLQFHYVTKSNESTWINKIVFERFFGKVLSFLCFLSTADSNVIEEAILD